MNQPQQAAPQTVMDNKDLAQDFQNQFKDVVSRFQSKQFFQSDWDVVSFAVFFIFIGMILMMVIVVLLRCCCSCCCFDDKPQRKKVGAVNLALQP